MQKQILEPEKYWKKRSEGYSIVNQKELSGEQRDKWLKFLTDRFPRQVPNRISVLDIGTGPGFFAIILAMAGYHVTAVDYTEKMLEHARINANILTDSIKWMPRILPSTITCSMLLYHET